MNIKKKLLIVLALPMCLIAFAAYFFGTGIVHELQDAKKLITYNHSFLSLSHFIHEVQKERAKSSLFLGNNLSAAQLKEHRDLVSQVQGEAFKEFMEAGPKSSDVQVWESALSSLTDLRSKVDGGIPAADSAKAFGQIVDKIIVIQLSFSRSIQFQSLQDRLLSLALLTTAKEYAGRLRANVINLLTKNQPLSPVQLVTVNNLKGGVVSNMESMALVLSEKGFGEVAAFKENADWKEVNNVIERVIEKSLEGNFEKNPNDFYKSITAAIDAFLVITDGESRRFDEELTAKVATLQTKIFITFAAGGVALCIIFASMGIVLRQLISQLKKIMERLNFISLDLEKVGGRATDSSSSLSSGTTESAASLEETVASLEELLSMVKTNSTNAEEALKLSLGGAEKAAEGEKSTAELVRSMQDISESSNKIKDIVGVIDDIAFQINLLALNAAVEAARAGEQGRGFAVVADAVRALALKSAGAAKDINRLIAESVEKIERGGKVASKSSDYLNSLAGTIKRISQINSEIANASQEQTTGFSQISQAMNQIDSSTQSNAAAAEGVSQISGEMSQHAHELGTVVEDLSKFVVGNRKAA